MLVFAAWVCLGCRDLAGMARAHVYEMALHIGGVDSTSLTVPLMAPTGFPSSATNPLAIRAMVRRGDFATLDSLLTAMADSARRDFHYEGRLYGAYEAFDSDTTLGAPLDRWVETHPTSSPARIARAYYLADAAWRARGTAYARYTARSAMRRMDTLMWRAVADIDSAVAITPQSAAAYRLRIEIAKVDGHPSEARAYLTKGLEDIPASFGLRRMYMRNLIPRWGGSYDAMHAFAAESQSMADSNPRLRGLTAYATWDSAEVLELQGNRSAALAGFSEAVAQSDEPGIHLERGQLLVRMRRFADALPDLDSAVAMAPDDATAYLWRGMAREALIRSHRELGPIALVDYQRAVLLNPSDVFALDRFALLYVRYGSTVK